jgi:hypothetical protein
VDPWQDVKLDKSMSKLDELVGGGCSTGGGGC